MAENPDQQIKIIGDRLQKFTLETRRSFSSVTEDLDTFERRQEDILRGLKQLEAEFRILKTGIEEQTIQVKKIPGEVKKTVDASTDAIEESLIGKTRIVEKITTLTINPFRWIIAKLKPNNKTIEVKK